MKLQSLAVLLGSLCAVSTALATTYVRVEKDGTKTYSDRPIPGGQPIELQPAQTYSSPQSSGSTDSHAPREEQLLQHAETFRYASCTLSPENDTTFQMPDSVTVSLSTSPALRDGDVVSLTVDGQPVGGPNSVSYTVSPVNRGTHSVGASVANTYGAVLCSTSSQFHVMQPGLNSPARQPAPRPPPRPPRPTPH